MDLINNTPYPHLLFRTAVTEDRFAASVVMRVTYNIVQGKAQVANEQYWPVEAGPVNTAYGELPGDYVYRRGGVDILLFGNARAPGGRAVNRMEVRVVLPGKIDHRLHVIGNRFWQKGLLGIGISEPQPFTEMPLTLSNAYGGTDEWDQLPVPYPNNPAGKGFIWEKTNVAGKPLPNIEDPRQLISKWNDRPKPAGFVPITVCEQRINKALAFDSKNRLSKLDPLFFNTSFLEMIAPEVLPGEKITVHGVKTEGLFELEVPSHALNAQLSFGEKQASRRLYIEQVGLEPDENRCFITYRYAFNYTMRPMEKRSVILNENV